jgi:hypothetical protein
VCVRCADDVGDGIPSSLVYLDLNKWVDLASAETNNPAGEQYKSALTTAEELASTGKAIFPLSFAHFIEVAKIGDNDRRSRLARLMSKLSQGWFFVSASCLMRAALRRAVGRQFQKPFSDERIAPVSRSLKAAFATSEKLKLAGADFEDTLLDEPRVLEELLSACRSGSSFVNRWRTIAQEHESGRSLRWSASKDVRKRAYCVLVTEGIQNDLISVLAEFGLTWQDFADLGPKWCLDLLESVPSLDVEINLFVERNEHRDRKIQANDELDLAFLSLAVPSCRAVVTERFWTSLIRRMKLDVKYGTYVTSDLSEVMVQLRV